MCTDCHLPKQHERLTDRCRLLKIPIHVEYICAVRLQSFHKEEILRIGLVVLVLMETVGNENVDADRLVTPNQVVPSRFTRYAHDIVLNAEA